MSAITGSSLLRSDLIASTTSLKSLYVDTLALPSSRIRKDMYSAKAYGDGPTAIPLIKSGIVFGHLLIKL